MRKHVERFNLVMSPDDKALLQQLADAEHESAAVVIRRLIREALAKQQAASAPTQAPPAPEETWTPDARRASSQAVADALYRTVQDGRALGDLQPPARNSA